MRQLTNIMAHLRLRKNQIENRGGQGLSGRWYPINPEQEDLETPYLVDARRILDEMTRVHKGHRAQYLAEELQKISEAGPRLF